MDFDSLPLGISIDIGTLHIQKSMIATASTYAKNIIKINDNDIFFSAAKLFFAYGLGNALTFPMSVGATSILMTDRPTPESIKCFMYSRV